ncbi:hypothetical protein [Streptomyces qinglanensis]|uniref:hypothetical protein n=1 Tax=Streptomyces qinglanensis TaxID=943816 RepID=UPI003D723001
MAVEVVSYRDLSELKFDKMDAAITKWKEIKKEFHDIATGRGEGADVVRLESKAAAADWTGANADISKPFVVEVAREFHDAANEAKSIHKAIDLARQRMHKHQSDLRRTVEDIQGDGLIVTSDGTVTDSMCYADEAKQKLSDKKVRAAEVRIEKILKAAASSQHALADGLRLLVQDAHDFSGADYGSYDDIRKVVGRADADKAVDLAKELSRQAANGDRIDQTKLDSFNDLAELQHSNPVFAEGLATKLGPKGTLEFWRMMSGDGPAIMTKSEYGREMVRLRDNLGMTLATASRVKSPEMAKWKHDLIGLGARPIAYPDMHVMHDPVGFQVMSSLMGKGKFDKDFLHDYEEKLRAFDKKIGGEGQAWSRADWQGTDLDPSGLGRGSDPMAGLLKAASHNPDFATDLFKDPDTAEYYLRDREYPPEDPYLENGRSRAAEALGDALYAGGSGLNPDDPNATYTEHLQDQNTAFHNIFDRLAAEKDGMLPEVRESMAMLLGNHGEETYDTMSAVAGSRDTPLDQQKLMEISKQISRTPEGYAALNQAMNQSMVNDILTEKDHPSLSADHVGRTLGFEVQARQQAIADSTAADQKAAGWKGYFGYFAVAELSTIPPLAPVGGHIANAAFGISKAWTEDEQAQIAEDGALKNKDVSFARANQIKELGHLWYEVNGNSDFAQNDDEWGSKESLEYRFDEKANDGEKNAERILGAE